MINTAKIYVSAAALALCLAGATTTVNATPFAAAGTTVQTGESQVVNVGWKRDRKYKKYRRHHHRRHYHDDRHVDAPFTSVDSYRGRVDVDAPFARVHRSRRGVHVRAPFVDLYIPR